MMNIHRNLIHLPIGFLAALFLPPSLSCAADRSVAEFNSNGKANLKWRVVNDGVMGGLSRGEVSFPDSGILRFRGNLSLENNGGFSSVRTGPIALDLSDNDGILLRVRGDGRRYQLRLGTDVRHRFMEVSFKAEFDTRKDEWSEIQVPFSDFVGSFRGRELKDKTLDPAKTRRLGLLLADKKAGPFNLEVDWIRAYKNSEKQNLSTADTILDQVVGDDRFQILATALGKANLLETLRGEDNLTVFAPTDKAFSGLQKGTLESLLEPRNAPKLRSILEYHMSPGTTRLAGALETKELSSVQGQSLKFSFVDGAVKVNSASLIEADISCSNGVIHILDAVLLPPTAGQAPQDIVAIARAAGNFDKLLALVDAAGLTSALRGDGPITLFAPTDEAIARLPENTVQALLREENREQLNALLKYHVIPGRLSSGDALNKETAETLTGQSLSFKIRDGSFQVQESTIRSVDLECSNGVIHVIDQVLLPPESGEIHPGDEKKSGTCEPGKESITPLETIRAAIEKGVPVFNGGDPAGCASIYQDCVQSLIDDTRVDEELREFLVAAKDRARESRSERARAWMFRTVLDHVGGLLPR